MKRQNRHTFYRVCTILLSVLSKCWVKCVVFKIASNYDIAFAIRNRQGLIRKVEACESSSISDSFVPSHLT